MESEDKPAQRSPFGSVDLENQYLTHAIALLRATLASYEQIFHILVTTQAKMRQELEEMEKRLHG